MPLPYSWRYDAARIELVTEYTEGAGDTDRISTSWEVAEVAWLPAKQEEVDMTEDASLSSSGLRETGMALRGRVACMRRGQEGDGGRGGAGDGLEAII